MSRFSDQPRPLVPPVSVIAVAGPVITNRALDNPGRSVAVPDYDDLRHVPSLLLGDAQAGEIAPLKS